MNWRLFIDSSNRSLEAILLHRGNKFSFIPVGHSVAMKKSHRTMERVLSRPFVTFAPGSHNVLSHHLVDLSKDLLSPLHIKLGLMENIRQGRQ